MKKLSVLVCFLLSVTLAFSQKKEKGWVSLFDGKTFDGWKINEDHPATFSIEDGIIKVAGEQPLILRRQSWQPRF